MANSSPYLGLRPYRKDEQDNFYGRNEECKILIEKLLTHRLTLLFAASGVGKSSLLNAAVIPTLGAETGHKLSVVYQNDWVTAPLQTLQTAIDQQLQHTESATPNDKHSNESLAEQLKRYSNHHPHPLILILDQFEEFFRYQRHNKIFKQLIQQLTEVIRDHQLAVHICFSMREDFALELNAFKPELPTLLFENFYRLEKLSEQATQLAVLEPLKKAGYQFEQGLLSTLLDDLLSRELGRDPNHPVYDASNKTAEPPYLQIVCSQLWALNKNDPEKIIRTSIYEQAGKATGLLENYVERELARFTVQEKQYASKAFDHLISQRGTKMAYTAEVLAHTLRINKNKLQHVLDKLEKQWIVRRQKRDNILWYELYHDMFSDSLDDWNTRWKNKMRTRQAVIGMSSVAVALMGLYVTFDYWNNATHYHLRSQNKPYDYLEVYQGKKDSADLFQQQRYRMQTRYQRKQMEPDKCVKSCDVIDNKALNNELIANLPLLERISAYTDDGQFDKALELIDQTFKNNNKAMSIIAAKKLAAIQIPATLPKMLQEWHNTSSESVQGIIGIFFPTVNSSALFMSKTLPEWEEEENFTTIQQLTEENYNNPLLPSITDYIGNDDALIKFVINEHFEKRIIIDGYQTIAPLVTILQEHKDKTVRIAVVESLVKLHTPKIIPTLITALADKEHKVRHAVIEGLGVLQATEAIPALIKKLENQEDEDIVIITLATLNATQAIQPLLNKFIHQKMDEENSEYRYETTQSLLINALVTLNATTAIQPLINKLNNQDEETSVRRDAIKALATFKANEAVHSLINNITDRDIGADALEGLINILNEKDGVTVLTNMLSHQKKRIRDTAIRLLGKMKQPIAIPLLFKQLKKEYIIHDYLDGSIIKVLRTFKSSDIAPLLINTLSDSDEDKAIRQFAIEAIVELKATAAIPVLLTMMKHDDADLSESAIDALGDIKATEAIQPLIQQLTHQNRTLAHSAAIALGKIKATEAIPALIKAITDQEERIQSAALTALAELNVDTAIPWLIKQEDASSLGTLRATEAIPLLLNLLDAEDEYTHIAAINALVTLNVTEAGQPLLSMLLNQHGVEYDYRLEISNRAIIEALGELKVIEAVPLLITMLNAENKYDEYEEQHNIIATALTKIGSRKAITPLLQQLYNPSTYQQFDEYDEDYDENVDAAAPIHRSINPIYISLKTLAKKHDYPSLNIWLDHLIQQDKSSIPEKWLKQRKLATLNSKLPAPALLIEQINNTTQPRSERIEALDNLMRTDNTELVKTTLLTLLENEDNERVFGHRLYQYLADHHATEAVETIQQKLQALNTQWQQWRTERDNPDQAQAADKPASAYIYTHTIARLAPQQGIKLLEHPLASARRGAWEGLATLADVELVKQLDQHRAEHKDNPVVYHAAYRAIDLSLMRIDANARLEDRNALNAYLQAGVIDKKAVAPRIEWTRDRIDETLANLKLMQSRIAHWFDE